MDFKKQFTQLAVVLLAGCAATVPLGDVKTDAMLKQFSPPPDAVRIYIYRNENYGSAYKLDVLVDGMEIGSTSAKTYLYKDVSPGSHTITSKGEDRDTVEVNAKIGTLVFVWQEAKFGTVYLRSKLHVVNPVEGRAGVQESRLAAP